MPTSSPNTIYLLVFFVYGLAFFCMGLAIALESRRTPMLADARVLAPLALFGILHGIHEWVEMFIQIGRWLNLDIPPVMIWLRLALLVISFSSLILFGLNGVSAPRQTPAHPGWHAVSGVAGGLWTPGARHT